MTRPATTIVRDSTSAATRELFPIARDMTGAEQLDDPIAGAEPIRPAQHASSTSDESIHQEIHQLFRSARPTRGMTDAERLRSADMVRAIAATPRPMMQAVVMKNAVADTIRAIATTFASTSRATVMTNAVVCMVGIFAVICVVGGDAVENHDTEVDSTFEPTDFYSGPLAARMIAAISDLNLANRIPTRATITKVVANEPEMTIQKHVEQVLYHGLLAQQAPLISGALMLAMAQREAVQAVNCLACVDSKTGSVQEQRDAATRLEKLVTTVARVTVNISQVGANVTCDGQPWDVHGLSGSRFVLPGKHTMRATLDGYQGASETFTAKAGESVTVTLKLVPRATRDNPLRPY